MENETLVQALRIAGALFTLCAGVEILLIAYEIGNWRLIRIIQTIGAFFIAFSIVRVFGGSIPTVYVLASGNVLFFILFILLDRHRRRLKRIIPDIDKPKIDYVIGELLGAKKK